jgi:hypothetical protein
MQRPSCRVPHAALSSQSNQIVHGLASALFLFPLAAFNFRVDLDKLPGDGFQLPTLDLVNMPAFRADRRGIVA